MAGIPETASKENKMTYSQFFINYGAVIAFLALVLFNIIFTKNFFQVDTLFLIIKQSTSLLLVTIGMTIVISAGGTDISAGSMMGFSGIIATLLLTNGVPFGLAALGGILACMLVGLFNGYVIGKVGVQPIILTLVMQIALRGMTVMLANSTIVPLSGYESVRFVGLKRFWDLVPIQVFYFIIVAVAAWFIIRKTVLGKYVEALGSSAKAARLTGIRTLLITIMIYVLSGFFAGIAGVLEMSRSGALDPNLLGKLFELDAVAAVAIGGTSMKGGKAKVMGSILGCLIIIMVGTTVNMNGIAYSYSNLIKAGIIIVSLAIQREKTN